MLFNVGDAVMHWTYGYGHVVGIEERVISEKSAQYYAISIRDLTVWVPLDDQLATRLRPPATQAEFEELFSILSGTGEPLPEDRQFRKLAVLETLKDGKASSLCRVVRDLTSYQQAHNLSETDAQLLKRTREALLAEWTHTFSITPREAEDELHKLLLSGNHPVQG